MRWTFIVKYYIRFFLTLQSVSTKRLYFIIRTVLSSLSIHLLEDSITRNEAAAVGGGHL